jgi:hypothetical protein
MRDQFAVALARRADAARIRREALAALACAEQRRRPAANIITVAQQ